MAAADAITPNTDARSDIPLGARGAQLPPTLPPLSIRLDQAIQSSADTARERAHLSLQRANSLCMLAACGAEKNIPAVTSAMHMAASDTMIYAKVASFTGALGHEHARSLQESAGQLQERALHLERLHRRGELSPSQIYFDDVLPQAMLAPATEAQEQDQKARLDPRPVY